MRLISIIKGNRKSFITIGIFCMVLLSLGLYTQFYSPDDMLSGSHMVYSNPKSIDVGVGSVSDIYGLKMDLVVDDFTYKCLEVEIFGESELSQKDFEFYITESNFNSLSVKNPSLSKKRITQKLIPATYKDEKTCLDFEPNGTGIDCSFKVVVDIKEYYVDEVVWDYIPKDSEDYLIDMHKVVYPKIDKSSNETITYRYCFEVPIVLSNGKWENEGTVYMELGEDVFVDKQNSTWWRTSYAYKKDITVQTTSNLALAINGTDSFTGRYIWTNPSMGNLSIYYNDANDFAIVNDTNASVYYEKESDMIGFEHTETYNPGNIAIWHFGNGSLGESSGTFRNLTNDGADNVSAIYGKGYDFVSGNADWMTSVDFLNGLSTFSMTGWVKPDSTSHYDTILGLDGAAHGDFLIFDNTGAVVARVNNAITLTSNISYDTGWNHFAWVADGTNVALYLNGTLVGYSALSGNSLSTTVFNVGAFADGDSHADAIIDELRIYGIALTRTEVIDMYNNGINQNMILGATEEPPVPPPSFADVLDITQLEDFGILSLNLTNNLSDVSDTTQQINISYSMNSSGNLSITVNNITKVLNFTSVANKTGVVNVNLTALNSKGIQNSTVFDFIITAVNDKPFIAPISDISLNRSFGTLELNLSNNISDVETSVVDLGLTYTLDDISIFYVNITNSTNNVTFTSILDNSGTVLMNITVVDDKGLTASTQFNVNILDTAPPLLDLIAPANSSNWTSSTIDFNWTATDESDPTLSCDLYLNGVANETAIACSNGTTCNQQITGIGDSTSIPWYVTCTDGTNTNTSLTRRLRIDTTAPPITIASPINQTYRASTTTIDINVSTTDELISGWWYIRDHGAITIFTPNISVSLGSGSYNYQIWANDTFNNSGYENISFTINSFPLLSLNDPVNGFNQTSSTVDFNWTYTDNENSSMLCDLYIGGILNSTETCSTGTLCNKQITGLQINGSSNNWYVNCTDGFDTNLTSTRNFTLYKIKVMNFSISSTSSLNFSNGSLTFSYDYFNNKQLAESLTEITWYVDDVENASLANQSFIEAANLSTGQIWNATVRVYDGYFWSPKNSSIIAIGFSAPSTPVLVNPPDNFILYNFTINLTCDNSTDIDIGDTVYYEFWQNFTNGSSKFILQNTTAKSYIWDISGNDNITLGWTCRAHDNILHSQYAIARTIRFNTSTVYDIVEGHTQQVYGGNIENFFFNVSFSNSSLFMVTAEFKYINDVITVKRENRTSELVLFNASYLTSLPAFQVTNNFTWNITLYHRNGSISIQSRNYTQVIDGITLDNCTANNVLILNYTIFDESTKSFDSLENISIELDITLTNFANSTDTLLFNATYNTTNAPVCISNFSNVTNTNFKLDSTARYSADDHEVEYHYIQNFNLSIDTIPNNIFLYDLATAEAQSFLITFKDNSYIPVDDAIIDLWRFYVGDGKFISVEHGKTNNKGETILNMIVEDVIYKFFIRKNGVLLWESENYQVICQSVPCTLSLQQTVSDLNTTDYEAVDNLEYNLAVNESNRDVTLVYSTTDGSSATVSLNITLFDNYQNYSVCYSEQTSSGGTISCSIPTADENVTYFIEFRHNDNFVTYRMINLVRSAFDNFGNTGIMLTALTYTTLVGIGASTGVGIIVFGIIGLSLATLLTIFNGGSIIGKGAPILWIIVAGAILLWKISKRRNN